VEESDLGSTRLGLLCCLLRVKSVSNLGCNTAATIPESKRSDLEGDVRRLLRSWNDLSYALPFLFWSPYMDDGALTTDEYECLASYICPHLHSSFVESNRLNVWYVSNGLLPRHLLTMICI
jgi:hypothetical protein